MPYRVLARRDETDDAELREIAAIRAEAGARVTRIRWIVGGGVALAVALFFVAVGPCGLRLSPPRVRQICHNVEIRFENAPEVPPSVFQSCRSVPIEY